MENETRKYCIANISSHLGSNLGDALYGSDLRQSLLNCSNLIQSGGPWLVTDNNQVVFDGVNAGCGLGYNSGPLFGTAQFAGAWSGDWDDPDIQAVQNALRAFVERKQHWKSRTAELTCPSQLIRTYIAINVLEQFETKCGELTSNLALALADSASRRLQSRASEFLCRTTVANRQVVCDFPPQPPSVLSRLLEHGVLAERASETRATVEVPLMATRHDLDLLAERIISAWLGEVPSGQFVSLRDYGHYYRFHSQLLEFKQQAAQGQPFSVSQMVDYLKELLPPEIREVAYLSYVTGENWPIFREAVDQMQKAIYEPVRQTSTSTFDKLFQDEFGYGLLIQVDGQIAGIASAGPLCLFPNERGTLADECRNDRHILYPLDLTVAEPFRGSLGTFLKRGMALIGLAAGHRAFHGRNRDRLAAAMWAINLSLGSYQIRHLPNDYPDSHPYRDCIYYRCPLRWSESNQNAITTTGPSLEYEIAKLLYC